MSPLRWPVIIFDLDGTLVDTIGLIVASYQHAFTTVLGHPWDEAEIKTWIGTSLIDAMRTAAPEQADAIYAEYTSWNEANTESMIHNYPGLPELISDLLAAGARMGVATSKRDEPAKMALRLAGLDASVPLLVAHDDVRNHKPDPEPLMLALSKLGGSLADAVYVGDAAVDALAARNAGMHCISVTWGAGTREAILAAGPTVVCDSVDELRAALLPASRSALG